MEKQIEIKIPITEKEQALKLKTQIEQYSEKEQRDLLAFFEGINFAKSNMQITMK